MRPIDEVWEEIGAPRGYRPLPAEDESLDDYIAKELGKHQIPFGKLVETDWYWEELIHNPNASVLVSEAKKKGMNPGHKPIDEVWAEIGVDKGYRPIPTKDESLESYIENELGKHNIPFSKLIETDWYWDELVSMPNAQRLISEAKAKGMNPIVKAEEVKIIDARDIPVGTPPEPQVIEVTVPLMNFDPKVLLKNAYSSVLDYEISHYGKFLILKVKDSMRIPAWTSVDGSVTAFRDWMVKMINFYDGILYEIPWKESPFRKRFTDLSAIGFNAFDMLEKMDTNIRDALYSSMYSSVYMTIGLENLFEQTPVCGLHEERRIQTKFSQMNTELFLETERDRKSVV